MHINSMPDLVLRLIFERLSLQDLLSIRRVCLLWRKYQLETGQRVHSLTLLFFSRSAQSLITKSCFTLKYRDLLLNDDGTRMYSSQYLPKRYHLTYHHGTWWRSELMKIFPNITTLELTFNYPFNLLSLEVVSLLDYWVPQLKSLKIYFQHHICDYQLVDLFKVINSMSSLEHLTLHNENLSNDGSKWSIFFPKHLDLPILGKLHEFYFNWDSQYILDSLADYAVSNDNLKLLGLKLDYSDLLRGLRTLNRQFPSLARKLVQLPLPDEVAGTDVEIINKATRMVLSFNSLSCFHLDVETSLDLLNLNSLAHLKQLTHLYVKMRKFKDLRPSNHVSRDQMVQLASVLVLTFTISKTLKSKSVFKFNHWAYLFPSVQVIELNLKFPSNRLFGKSKIPQSLPKQVLEQSLTPFVQCPKLHHIFVSGNREDSRPEFDFIKWFAMQEDHRKILIKISK